jgi:hypothetical protein
MAGYGIPQDGISTSEITPSYSVPHDNAIAEALGNAGNAAQGVINGMIEKHYASQGAAAGAKAATAQAAASESATQAAARPDSDSAQQQAAQDKQLSDAAAQYAKIPVITNIGQARQAAFQGSYLAGIKTDIDTHIDQTEQAHLLDPSGFKSEADGIVKGYAQGAPGQFAVAVQDYAQQRAASALNKLTNARTQHDQVRSVNDVKARQQTLSDDMSAMASAGTDQTPEFAAKQTEWNANNAQMVANPLFEYGPNQAAAAADKQAEVQAGAVLTYHATKAYDDAGGGEAGKEAALKLLHDEAFGADGALSDSTPERRLKLYGVAAANITALDKDDAEQRRIDAEKARADHADQRDAAGTLALGLTDGSVSEADIHAAEKAGKIEDGAAARLIMGKRAQHRQAAAQGRMASAAEHAGNYGAALELSVDGKLTPDYLANLNANGAITPVQYAALKGRLNKQAKPAIENILGLARSAFHDNGVVGASATLALVSLRADAAEYVSKNPDITVGQQTAFASQWIKVAKGIVTPATMTAPTSAHLTDAQVNTAYLATFHGQSPSQSEVAAHLKAFRSAHPK